MSLSVTPNITCDIYRSGNAPPSAPDVQAVSGFLAAVLPIGQEGAETDGVSWSFTHFLLVNPTTDIRDEYNAGTTNTNKDTIYVPDKNGTPFDVIFVERHGQGTPGDHKKVYLNRGNPMWPTEEL